MEETKIDTKKPFWWVILVLVCMVTIYFIGISPENNDYPNDVRIRMVENLNSN